MAHVHETALRNAIGNAVITAIDNGASAGKLVFETSADASVATITFNATCGTVATGVVTFSGLPKSDTSATAGVIEHASFYDGDTTPLKLLEVTCGVTGQEINLSSLTIANGDVVKLNSLTYTTPA